MKTISVYDTTETVIEKICDRLGITEAELMEDLFENGYIDGFMSDNDLDDLQNNTPE